MAWLFFDTEYICMVFNIHALTVKVIQLPNSADFRHQDKHMISTHPSASGCPLSGLQSAEQCNCLSTQHTAPHKLSNPDLYQLGYIGQNPNVKPFFNTIDLCSPWKKTLFIVHERVIQSWPSHSHIDDDTKIFKMAGGTDILPAVLHHEVSVLSEVTPLSE